MRCRAPEPLPPMWFCFCLLTMMNWKIKMCKRRLFARIDYTNGLLYDCDIIMFFSSNVRIMYTRLHVVGISFLLSRQKTKKKPIKYSIFFFFNKLLAYTSDRTQRDAVAEFLFLFHHFAVCYLYLLCKTLLIQLFATYLFFNHFWTYMLKTSSNLLWFWLYLLYDSFDEQCLSV